MRQREDPFCKHQETSFRFPSLKAGGVDVLVRNTTWTLDRETVLGLLFGLSMVMAVSAQISLLNRRRVRLL
jgi:hypothetical protein